MDPKPDRVPAGQHQPLLWFVGLWLGGVALLAAVAAVLRWVLPG